MVYAGFWKRFFASLIDSLVLLPFAFINAYVALQSKTLGLLLLFPMTFLFSGYNIYFHARWGQTIGKKVMKIRVTKLSGERIFLKEAFLRHAVDLGFAVLLLFSAFMAFSQSSNPGGIPLGLPEESSTSWGFYAYIDFANNLWVWSELIVLLFNEKKRAIHDFIAGTVVLDLEAAF